MADVRQMLNTFREICGFTESDRETILHMAPYIRPRIEELTNVFYVHLLTCDETAPYIEDRIEKLKQTHEKWLYDLFDGDYGEDFIERQVRIGKTHVEAKIPPVFVAASMSYLRGEIPKLIDEEAARHGDSGSQCIGAFMRVMDFCQLLIDQAYNEERLNRLTEVTGMSGPLLENLIALKAAKKAKAKSKF